MQDHTELRVIRQRATASARAFLGCSPQANPSSSPVRSLYIHVPFCFHKCHYCDFYSIVDTRDRQPAFVDRLERELRAIAPWAAGAPLLTIFVGGGTPSLLAPDLWSRLLTTLASAFDLSLILRGEGEFTVECNPETVTPDLMHVLRAGGVNRVSMGAQSFDKTHLKTLERWHDPESVPRAIQTARDAGIPRQSLDLIYAVPGQTLADLDRDLDAALALRTEHLSAYSLTYEPGTAMTARLARGDFTRADEDLEADMFEHVGARLESAGLERYEVSNFARPGAPCRHNLAYWRQEDWLAAGPSASGHVAGHRWKNVPRLDEYLDGDDAGFAPIIDHEPPDPRRGLAERLMTGIRLAEGLDLSHVESQAGTLDPALPTTLDRIIARHESTGLVARSDGRLRLTSRGLLLADLVARDLVAAVMP